ncbi:TATA box-binding protein-associated factor RNA polymerase I subunit C isoform X2 [Dasypus novemcinctus]|uniref:TATA box-binding protein-associated factor RNA polymerase I subunit C isoform X2 n=1 Tax=Dasypus novemcinctus TaxID=9361 RepID=UPI00265E904C|nr:TATA box-binding protein-associated factor RNA polymerase I subunit C isoform X2 [Dasypus novemcinctus]
MDFPSSLRPTLFTTGPLGLSSVPDLSFMCSWRDALTLPVSKPQNPENAVPPSARVLRWEPETPGPLPLLPPSPEPWEPGLTAKDLLFRESRHFRRQPRATLDVTEQLSRFLWDHGDVAFAPLGKLMQENFKLEGARSRAKRKTVVSVKRLLQDLSGHQPWGCPWAYLSHRQRRFSVLGGPVLASSMARLLGELLHEELATRWGQLLLDDAFTGGALAWVPGRSPRVGQLIYPTGGALDRLRFQNFTVTPSGEPQLHGDPSHIQLRGPVRQVVTLTVQGESLLAVRSDYHCAVWRVGRQGRPTPLQVLQVEKGATGVKLSPHLPGELAVSSRSGAVCLWTPQDGLRQFYKDSETLVFRDPSPWRWADFTAHPRVLTVADRTGMKMMDTQGPPGCGLMLFRVGAEASCQKGERVLLTQYLGASGPESFPPTLHLVCTQFSLYLVDERLPLVPMLKWDHGLPSSPLLAQLLPPPRPGCPSPLLLGGRGGQLQLLHVSAEEASAPRLAGPPQSLPSRTETLSAFPLLEPRRQRQLQERLEAPTIGLAATLPPSASRPVLSLFQLSAAGDVFYQHLCLQEDASLHGEPGPPGDPGPGPHVPTLAAWSPQATAHCSRWLEALQEVPLGPPVWTAPTFSHRHLLCCQEQPVDEGAVRKGLRVAMAQGQLLRPRDLGPAPTAEPPPAPESGPEDELSERLAEAWEGRGALWWERRQGGASGSGKQPRRPKRRTPLSSTFSSLSGRLDLSTGNSPPLSPGRASPEPRPRPPTTPPSQPLTQEPWTRGVPVERQQTLRDYVAKLPSPATLTPATPSQTSSVRTTPSRTQAPGLSGSQPPRKKPRMGF